MIKAVVFDIGGVLLDNPDVKNFWKNSKESKMLGEEFGAGDITTEQFISRGSKLLEVTEREFLKEYKKTYLSIRPKKEVIEIFRKLKLNKYILSDTNPLVSEKHLLQLKEIMNLTKGCFLSHKIGMRKTSSSTFNFILKEIGINSKGILFVDDSSEHLGRARKFGINTLLFRNSQQLTKDLKKLGVK